jgi:hypothetical protein
VVSKIVTFTKSIWRSLNSLRNRFEIGIDFKFNFFLFAYTVYDWIDEVLWSFIYWYLGTDKTLQLTFQCISFLNEKIENQFSHCRFAPGHFITSFGDKFTDGKGLCDCTNWKPIFSCTLGQQFSQAFPFQAMKIAWLTGFWFS